MMDAKQSRTATVEGVLHLSYAPKTTKHRDEELKRIKHFLHSDVTGTLYVCGGPGTGKTLHVEQAVASLEVTWLRGTSFANGEAFIRRVGREVGSERVDWDRLCAREAVAELEARRKHKRKLAILVVDEIDSLVAVAAEAAKRVFQLATKVEAKLKLVAIANAIDLPQRALAARAGDTVVFEPYKYPQLREIVEDRLKAMGGGLTMFEARAIEFAARKIAANAGDARKVLDLCAHAFRLARPARVELSHVVAAIAASAPSTVSSAVAALPPHARVALKAAIRLHNSSKTLFTKHDLACEYRRVFPGLVQDNSADEAFALLETAGFLKSDAAVTTALTTLNRGRPSKKHKPAFHKTRPNLRLNLDPKDIQRAFDGLASSF